MAFHQEIEDKRDLEFIKLLVSELEDINYSLDGHTAMNIAEDLPDDESDSYKKDVIEFLT